jgi:hypothetical protein
MRKYRLIPKQELLIFELKTSDHSLFIWIFLAILSYSVGAYGQDTENLPQDSAKTVVMLAESQEIIDEDSLEQQREDSPLDIAIDRGLRILADDGRLQMRILGSIRFSALYDDRNLANKNTFSTYEIPTGTPIFRVPNYYNSLNFSRIGFEITRRTTGGDFFIRLETDFAGPDNHYRIRHAYGQYRNWLIGQTWSLLTNVSSLPATVDPNGPVGAISGRTPQIRYSNQISNLIQYDVALEYFTPDYSSSDTIHISYVQTLPNLAARINARSKFGTVQVSGIIAPLTGIDPNGNRSTSFGFAGSLSGTWELNQHDRILIQGTYGRAIAHFMNPFEGRGQDMAYNPETSTFTGLNSTGGYLSYGHIWPKDISSYLSFGIASISNRYYQPTESYDFSYSISGNAFWKIVEGMRIGLEYLYGKRFNRDNSSGRASRIWALFYYDF